MHSKDPNFGIAVWNGWCPEAHSVGQLVKEFVALAACGETETAMFDDVCACDNSEKKFNMALDITHVQIMLLYNHLTISMSSSDKLSKVGTSHLHPHPLPHRSVLFLIGNKQPLPVFVSNPVFVAVQGVMFLPSETSWNHRQDWSLLLAPFLGATPDLWTCHNISFFVLKHLKTHQKTPVLHGSSQSSETLPGWTLQNDGSWGYDQITSKWMQVALSTPSQTQSKFFVQLECEVSFGRGFGDDLKLQVQCVNSSNPPAIWAFHTALLREWAHCSKRHFLGTTTIN